MRYEIISERNSKYHVKVSAPSDAYGVLKRFSTMRQEHFLVLTLDGAHQVIRSKIVSVGLVNRTVVHPREVFKPAIEYSGPNLPPIPGDSCHLFRGKVARHSGLNLPLTAFWPEWVAGNERNAI